MKKIILLMLVILLTACTVDYEIKVDENFDVVEIIKIPLEKKQEYSKIFGYNNPDVFVENMYNDLLEKTQGTSYKVKKTRKEIIVENKKTFEELNAEIFFETYEKFYSKCGTNACTIRARVNENIDTGDGTLPNQKIKIQVPYKVLKHNATEVDLKSNTYIWYYNVVEEKDNIEIIFEKEGKNIVEENKIKSLIIISVISIVVFIIMIFLIKFIYKVYKNGKPV